MLLDEKNVLDADTAFVSMAFINLLVLPFSLLPDGVAVMGQVTRDRGNGRGENRREGRGLLDGYWHGFCILGPLLVLSFSSLLMEW